MVYGKILFVVQLLVCGYNGFTNVGKEGEMMLSFLNVFFESGIVRILSFALILLLCLASPYYLPWIESSYFGQRLIETGIWPENMVFWPHDTGMKIITLGTIGVILTGYLSVALIIVVALLFLGMFIVVPLLLLKRKILALKADWVSSINEDKKQTEIPPGFRVKGNGKIVPIKLKS